MTLISPARRASRFAAVALTAAALLTSSLVAAAPATAAGTTGAISGHVSRDDGYNGSYLQVTATNVATAATYTAYANDFGNWSMGSVEPGDYVIEIPSSMYTMGLATPAFFPDAMVRELATPVTVAADASVVADMMLKRPGTVFGLVKAADRILAPVTVTLHTAAAPHYVVATTTTQPNGEFGLSPAAGEYKLKFTPSDDHDAQWLGGALTPETSETLTVKRLTYTDAGTTTVGENFTTVGTVAVAGTRAVGKILTASTTGWAPTPSLVTYQWFRNGSPVTLPSFSGARRVMMDDAGDTLTVVATSTLAGYLTAASTSAPVQIELALTATPTPTISGTSLVGKRLTATAGTWTPAPVTLKYRWTRDGKAITGATGRTYLLTRSDRGHEIRVAVTGSKAGYSTIVKTSARRVIR